MKYVSEISMFSLLALAVYAVLPGTTESRAVETENFIAREAEGNDVDSNAIRSEDLRNIIESYLADWNRSDFKRSAAEYYARAALKRSMKDELRDELAKRSYHNPIDPAGGSLLGYGILRGSGR